MRAVRPERKNELHEQFVAFGIFGSQQVGYGNGASTGNNNHALLWSGTPNTVVDLHSFLSSDYSGSDASAIDANGNIIGEAYHILCKRLC